MVNYQKPDTKPISPKDLKELCYVVAGLCAAGLIGAGCFKLVVMILVSAMKIWHGAPVC